MTGTAKTEEKEFVEIYDLHVVEIPTNVAVARDDENDLIFKTKEAKFEPSSRTSRSGTRRASPPRRHDRGRDLRVPVAAADAPRRPAQRPEREGARARGRDHQDAGQPPRSRSRRTWPAAASTSSSARGWSSWRPLRARHRAPRGAPDRQPATRPLRPPGRPRRVALLPLRPGRPRAPVRRRPDLQHHGALQAPGRPAHGGEDPLEPDRGGAEEGRGAELRGAQERPQVRRRHERPAPGDLRAAAEVLEGEDLATRSSGGSTRCRAHGGRVHRRRVPRNGTWTRSASDVRPLRHRHHRSTSCEERSSSIATR